MKNIVLISCVSKKLDKKSTAENIYVSPLFKKNLTYAKSLNPNEIYILSAEHGLLKLTDKIEPYDKTLNNMRSNEIKEWSKKVVNQLNSLTDLKNDEFTFLAGEKYRKYLIPELNNVKIPMKGLKIGKQLQWLTKQNN
ncbi:hypothetical protein MAR621_04122 [Maribacter dokdonensis]|uniref:DUF6884 domain-containing protein n=1 Tax=Maribacter dokdonensis TaxID=320912 RepID=UPI001B02008E|nr:DUF6884 domain-containing protein [Maribacter dokdonensis]CAG2534820.1 hypothetical protein MAR621_04122 [Maribacter dokdonensis]